MLPAAQALRPRRHPVESAAAAGCSAASLRKEREGSRRPEGRAEGDLEAQPRRARGVRGPLRRARRAAGRRRRSPGCWPSPVVTAPIIGPRTLEQLDGTLRALDIELDRQDAGQLDEIFPGHQTAPEDYAW